MPNESELHVVPFFSMNTNFLIAQDATLGDLQTDMLCLLESVRGTVSTLAEGLSETDGQIAVNPRDNARMLYGALYMLEMIDGMTRAAMKLPSHPDAEISSSLSRSLAHAMALAPKERSELLRLIKAATEYAVDIDPDSIAKAGDAKVRALFADRAKQRK